MDTRERPDGWFENLKKKEETFGCIMLGLVFVVGCFLGGVVGALIVKVLE